MNAHRIVSALLDSEYREPRSYFMHDGLKLNVNNLLKAARRVPVTHMPVSAFDWLSRGTGNPDRITKANTAFPILVFKQANGRWNIADGLHRMLKARQNGDEQIAVKVLDPALFGEA